MATITTLASLFDDYLAVVYPNDILINSIADMIGDKGKSVLDCACGTGFPSLQLRKRGFQVDCSDGDKEMLDVFRQNGNKLNVPNQAIHLYWKELSKLNRQYDIVMCRGNSLAYARTWKPNNHNSSEDDFAVVKSSLKNFFAITKPGGLLHIDVPANKQLIETRYDPVIRNGSKIEVVERVIEHNESGDRHWAVQIIKNGQLHEFPRRSIPLDEELLTNMLIQYGFEQVKPISLLGERENFTVIHARRPE